MKRTCVIGYPIEHSRSPLIHNYWIKKYSIAGEYTKKSVPHETIHEYLKKLKSNGFIGANVTIPHKRTALQAANEADAAAVAIGAANTLWYEREQLIAGNTDGYGFLTHLDTSAPDWPADRPAAVLGAGGAAQAVIYALQQRGVSKIRLFNRTRAKAEALAARFGDQIDVAPWQTRSEGLQDCGLLVNTTALGMAGNDPLEIDLSHLPQEAVVYDIVYVPLKTPLLAAAQVRQLRSVDGLGMLLHQAVPGFERWYGIRPEVTSELYAMVAQDISASSC